MTADATDKADFAVLLYEKMQAINPGIRELELYEFRYGLKNLEPTAGMELGLPGLQRKHPRARGEPRFL